MNPHPARVVVRQAARADAQAWLDLRSAFWPDGSRQEHRAEIEAFFDGRARAPQAVLLAAAGDGRIVGFAEISIRNSAEGCRTDRVAYLEGWYVVPGEHGGASLTGLHRGGAGALLPQGPVARPPSPAVSGRIHTHARYVGSHRSRGRAMIAAQITLVLLALLLMMAHFLRGGAMLLLVAVFAVAVMLVACRPWAARVAQVTLALGTLEWLRTLASTASARMRAGEPVVRLTIILGAVALVTAGAALVFETKRMRRLYGLDGGEARGE